MAGAAESVRCGGLRVDYRLDPVDFRYETPTHLLLADLVWDRSDPARLAADAAGLVAEFDAGTAPVSNRWFAGCYFAVVIEKASGRFLVARDPSGVKSGYLARHGDALLVGTNVHELARRARVRDFDAQAIHHWLHLDYFFDGSTFYRGVEEVSMGEVLRGDARLCPTREQRPLGLAEQEAPLGVAECIRTIRTEILEAHRRLAGRRNVVLLSGGIDSCAMLIALAEVSDRRGLTARSYRVSGTSEDETHYARTMAEALGVPLELVEVDPSDARRFEGFEAVPPRMNIPYFGVWIFGRLPGGPDHTLYAGQDTRLHTPDLNVIDQQAFGRYLRRGSWPVAALDALLALPRRALEVTGLDKGPLRLLRGAYRASLVADPERYIDQFYFKADRRTLEKAGLPPEHIEALRGRFRLDGGSIRSARQLYNAIVARKWGLQYTDDIRYMQDLGSLNGTFMAMPYYDLHLARAFSSLPFRVAARNFWGRSRYSSRPVLINKYLLREAFRDRLPEALYYRQKAVSRTIHQFFNGPLGDRIRAVIAEDRRSGDSVVARFGLAGRVARFMAGGPFRIADDRYLVKVHHVAVLCILNRAVLGA